MWLVLEQMYSHKKDVHIYQLTKDIYVHVREVSEYYSALKFKWEDFDYHIVVKWTSTADKVTYLHMEWKSKSSFALEI